MSEQIQKFLPGINRGGFDISAGDEDVFPALIPEAFEAEPDPDRLVVRASDHEQALKVAEARIEELEAALDLTKAVAATKLAAADRLAEAVEKLDSKIEGWAMRFPGDSETLSAGAALTSVRDALAAYREGDRP